MPFFLVPVIARPIKHGSSCGNTDTAMSWHISFAFGILDDFRSSKWLAKDFGGFQHSDDDPVILQIQVVCFMFFDFFFVFYIGFPCKPW